MREALGGAVAAAQARVHAHMPALDGLRGLAVLLVVLYHVGWVGAAPTALPARLYVIGANAGWSGVQLFFCLSGFLITGILLDTRGTEHAWRNFIARRSLRIFPLYYAVLLVVFLLLPAVGAPASWATDRPVEQLWFWTYLSNWCAPWHCGGAGLSHFWSLAVEEQFYLLWPLLAFRLKPRTLAWTCVGLALFALVSRVVLPWIMQPPIAGARAAYFWTFARWDGLALGALAAIALRDVQWAAWLVRWTPRLVAGTLALLLGFAVVNRGFNEASRGVEVWGHLLFAMAFTALVVWAATAPATTSAAGIRVLKAGWLRFVGKYSYALYVFHLPVAHVVKPLVPEPAVGSMAQGVAATAFYVGLVLAVSLGAALLSWRLLEAPMLSLKRHFSTTPVARAPLPRAADA